METPIKLFKEINYTPWSYQLVMNDYLFEYTLENFESDYKCKTLWLDFKDQCNLSIDDFELWYRQFIKKTDIYNEFNLDFSRFDTHWCNDDVFNRELEYGRTYLSIDLVHSYSQLIDKLGVFDKSFDEIISDSIDNPLFDNKKMRLCFYHGLDYHEDTKYFVTSLFEDVLSSDNELITKVKSLPIHQINVDELVYDITDCIDSFRPFVGKHKCNGINIRVDIFKPHRIRYYDEFNKECEYHIREYTAHNDYLGKDCRYMNQIYKIYNRKPINDLDLYVPDLNNMDFYYKLKEPIKLISME